MKSPALPFSYPPDLRRVLAPFRQRRGKATAGNSALGAPASAAPATDRRRAGGIERAAARMRRLRTARRRPGAPARGDAAPRPRRLPRRRACSSRRSCATRAGRAPNEWLFARSGIGIEARGRFAPCLDGSLSAGRGLGGDGRRPTAFLQSQFHRRRGWDRTRRMSRRSTAAFTRGRPTAAQMTSRLELVNL